MGSSPYFRNYTSSSEQDLIESLVHEAIKRYSGDFFYIKRVQLNPDNVIVDDKLSKFEKAFPVAMYIKTVDGFTGDGQFLSKFGVEIRDQVILCISKREFKFEVLDQDSLFAPSRPREGDLIYFPMTKKLFEITFVDYKPVMYQFGSLQAYDLTCEVFEYNNELFATGYDFLDNIFQTYVVPGDNNSPQQIEGEDGSFITGEDGSTVAYGDGDPDSNDPGSELTDINWEGQKFIDFTDQNPMASGNY
jgi:hypothetical protein